MKLMIFGFCSLSFESVISILNSQMIQIEKQRNMQKTQIILKIIIAMSYGHDSHCLLPFFLFDVLKNFPSITVFKKQGHHFLFQGNHLFHAPFTLPLQPLVHYANRSRLTRHIARVNDQLIVTAITTPSHENTGIVN